MGARTVAVSGSARVAFATGIANVHRAQLVGPGYRVRTGSTGRVILRFANGHALRIGPTSDLVLVSYQPQKKQTLLKLNQGRIWNKVRPHAGQRVVVRGRHATAAVMGTVYEVAETADQTQTTVIEGSVGVRRPEEQSGNEQIFDHLPALTSVEAPHAAEPSAFEAPVAVANPVHEIPSPVKVVPGPYEVSMDEWLQIVANQKISMGADGKAMISTIDPVAQQQNDEWFRWNRQMDQIAEKEEVQD